MGSIKELQSVEIAKIKPYKNNAKIHGKNQLKKLQESISEFGFLTPCLIDRDFNLIAGHGRVEAAKALGMKEVPCVFVEELTEQQRKAYILADNKLSELAEWDLEILNQELAELSEAGMDITLVGFELNNEITQELNDGVEISIESLGDENFKYECPECGFRFD